MVKPLSPQNARVGKSHSSEIVAAGFAYPSLIVDNDGFMERCHFDITDDLPGLIAETRMKTRTWCGEGENTWTLARSAVDMALAEIPGLVDEIDVILVASGTTMPVAHPPEAHNAGMADLAPLIARHIGRDEALGLDLKACYCTGFLRGLQVADGLLANPNYRSALVIATEQGSPFSVAESNRSKFCFIMSDAAGAVVLRRTEARPDVGLIDHVGYTSASRFDWVGIGEDAASTIMRGSRAGEATFEMLTECARKLLDRNNLSIEDIDWLLPIQTHAGLVEGVRAMLGCPAEKLLWTGNVTGFSGSASIPTCFAEQRRAGVIKPGDLVMSIAVGAGMNCGGALYRA
ncbi:MAG: 3-oxoacyl-[acyl-carrier-protein] synthase-3 [Myxococcota bacterium]|jgi:3-oxoacyl-[acyl-carrier-protein] synthase-3